MINTILLIIITIFIPPVGVFLISGCGADLLINILLTILGYFPGHIHAFYLEYVYYSRRDQARAGVDPLVNGRAPGVYSERVQSGGYKGPRGGAGAAYVPAQQGYAGPVQGQAQAQYGTV